MMIDPTISHYRIVEKLGEGHLMELGGCLIQVTLLLVKLALERRRSYSSRQRMRLSMLERRRYNCSSSFRTALSTVGEEALVLSNMFQQLAKAVKSFNTIHAVLSLARMRGATPGFP
jgi:hypothetical protein